MNSGMCWPRMEVAKPGTHKITLSFKLVTLVLRSVWEETGRKEFPHHNSPEEKRLHLSLGNGSDGCQREKEFHRNLGINRT